MSGRLERCKHEWIPNDINEKPKVCPLCKSPYWDRLKERFNKKYVIQYHLQCLSSLLAHLEFYTLPTELSYFQSYL